MKIPQPNPSKNPAESQTITSAIYIRVSATKHAEKQLSKLRGFAERQGWLVLEYLEEASTKMVARRPVLAQLLEDAKDGKFQVVICWRMDPPTALRLEDFAGIEVLAFLQHIEKERKATIRTRNCRLAAIRSFFLFVVDREPLDPPHGPAPPGT